MDPSASPRFNLEQIDGLITSLDNESITGSELRKGPFSIFRLSSAAFHPAGDDLVQCDEVHHSSGDAGADDFSSTPLSLYGTVTSPACPVPGLENTVAIASIIPSLSLRGDEALLDPISLDEDTEALEICSKLTLGQDRNPQNDNSAMIVGPPPDSIYSHLRFLTTTLSGDATLDMLMNHYIVYVADLLQPIRHPQNPFRTLYAPAALEVAPSLSPNRAKKSDVHSVLYHSLLAASAFHLESRTMDQHTYHKIGTHHRQQALQLLQSAINDSYTVAEYKTLLMAILSLVTVSVLSESEADFAIHLHGTKLLRNSRRRWKVMSSSTQQLNEMSAFMCLLHRTTSFKNILTDWNDEMFHDIGEDPEIWMNPACCWPYMYGITPTIASAIQETCRLAEHLSFFRSHSENIAIPEGLLKACELLGTQLLAWTLEDEHISTFFTNDNELATIFTHHANAWHTASIIYYSQRIQKSRAQDLHVEINNVATHMHAVEDVKAASESDHIRKMMAPMTWPAFIASCDATDRDIWTLWWERVQHYGIANIHRQWIIVQKIWQRKDELAEAGIQDPSWIDIFSDSGIQVLLI